MTGAPTGLLLPEGFLETRGFAVFATFVAINTVVYLGLTAAKLVPWPAQTHPDRIRAILPAPLRKEANMPASLSSARRTARSHDDVTAAFRERRQAMASRTIPLAFALLGGLAILESALGAALGVPGAPWQYVLQIVMGAVAIAFAQIAARGRIPATALSWIWAIAVALAVADLANDALGNDSTVALAYAIVCMTAILPIALHWPAGIVGTVVALAAFAIPSIALTGTTSLRWILAALFGVLFGAILLYVRVNGIDATTLEQLRSNTLATTDLLTGCFTRRGLLTLAPGFAANAARAHESLCVALVDVEDMSRINADYGFDYGDDVIAAMGHAVTATMREGDLIARWDGRTFLALGVGTRPDPDALHARIESHLDGGGIALGKRPIRFRVRTAAGEAGSATLEGLIAAADAG